MDGAGTLMIISGANGIASIYSETGNNLERIHELKKLNAKETILLQPGKYFFICRMNDKKNSLFTRTIDFEVISGQTTTIRL